MPTLVWVAGLVLAVVLAAVVWGARVRSRRRLARQAMSLDLNYRADDVLDLPRRYCALTLMREGHDRRAWDVMSGPTRWGAMSCFAYRYEVGFGIHRSVRSWLVAVLETDRGWGRIALRRNSPSAGQPAPWDGPGSALPHVERLTGQWTASFRADGPSLTLPDGLLAWLDSLGSDLCLELCDHLIALQVPLHDHQQQAAWLTGALQQCAERLNSLPEKVTYSEVRPAAAGARNELIETANPVGPDSTCGSGDDHGRP